MFVRYDCGCVGLVQGTTTYCIEACDESYCDDSFGFYIRPDLAEKEQEKLSDAEVRELLLKVDGLVQDGKKFRSIKRLLSKGGD
jgi:hypothetical protein